MVDSELAGFCRQSPVGCLFALNGQAVSGPTHRGRGRRPHYFGFNDEALALMCASHHGTEAHVAIDQRILDAIGLDKSGAALWRALAHRRSGQPAASATRAEARSAVTTIVPVNTRDVDPGTLLGMR